MRRAFLIQGQPGGEARESVDWRTRGQVYLRFWTQLLEQSRERTPLFANKPPVAEYHLHTYAGRSGFSLGYIISVHGWVAVDVFIDMGDKARNKHAFDALLAERTSIEKTFGAPLDWQRLENKRASSIEYRIEEGRFDRESEWPLLQERLIDAMIRLHKAIQPHIAALDV